MFSYCPKCDMIVYPKKEGTTYRQEEDWKVCGICWYSKGLHIPIQRFRTKSDMQKARVALNKARKAIKK